MPPPCTPTGAARRPELAGQPTEPLCDHHSRHAPRGRPARRSPRAPSPCQPVASATGPRVSEARMSVNAVAGSIAPFVKITARPASTAGLNRQQATHRLEAEITEPGQFVPALVVGMAPDDPGRRQTGRRRGQRIIDARPTIRPTSGEQSDAHPPEQRHGHPEQRHHQVLRLERTQPSASLPRVSKKTPINPRVASMAHQSACPRLPARSGPWPRIVPLIFRPPPTIARPTVRPKTASAQLRTTPTYPASITPSRAQRPVRAAATSRSTSRNPAPGICRQAENANRRQRRDDRGHHGPCQNARLTCTQSPPRIGPEHDHAKYRQRQGEPTVAVGGDRPTLLSSTRNASANSATAIDE